MHVLLSQIPNAASVNQLAGKFVATTCHCNVTEPEPVTLTVSNTVPDPFTVAYTVSAIVQDAAVVTMDDNSIVAASMAGISLFIFFILQSQDNYSYYLSQNNHQISISIKKGLTVQINPSYKFYTFT
jgi:hypothetical protein